MPPCPCQAPHAALLLSIPAAPCWGSPIPCNVLVQSASSWVKLNVGQYGVFRVNYPTALWQRLAGAANATASPLAPADLAGLLDDAFALSLTGDSPIDTFLSLTRCAHIPLRDVS